MGPDYSKRDYLLPKGYKDLAETLVIDLPKEPTVAQLAGALGQKPSGLIAELFQLGVFASAQQRLDFETASRLAQKHGYVARQT